MAGADAGFDSCEWLSSFLADGHDAAPGETYPRGYWPWKDSVTERYHMNFNLDSLGESLTLTKATWLGAVTLEEGNLPNRNAVVFDQSKENDLNCVPHCTRS